MTGAAATADPAAAAAGNATLMSGATGPADAPPPTPDPAPPADPPAEGEPKPAEPPAEPPKEGEEPTEPNGAPEDYGAFTAPEGVTLDPAALDEFKPVAKELGLTQDQAQRLVGIVAGMQARQAEAQAAQVQAWTDAVLTDKQLGGSAWAETRAYVARARDRFASPELVGLMESTGLGSHPEIIRLFAAVGRAIGDDSHVVGGSPATPSDFATDFYSRMPKLERVR